MRPKPKRPLPLRLLMSASVIVIFGLGAWKWQRFEEDNQFRDFVTARATLLRRSDPQEIGRAAVKHVHELEDRGVSHAEAIKAVLLENGL